MKKSKLLIDILTTKPKKPVVAAYQEVRYIWTCECGEKNTLPPIPPYDAKPCGACGMEVLIGEIRLACRGVMKKLKVVEEKVDATTEREFFVEIVKRETDEVMSRMGPMAERKADKVRSGASINLNHDEYFVRIV